MRKFLIGTLFPGLLLINSMPVFSADVAHSIRFNFKNATYRHVSMRCGNATYPGLWVSSGNYGVKPGPVKKPRELEYVCSIALHNRGEVEIARFGRDQFDPNLRSSQVLLIVEGVDSKAFACPKQNKEHHPAELMFSLSVDGNLLKAYQPVCF